jgi:hypothetical protein
LLHAGHLTALTSGLLGTQQLDVRDRALGGEVFAKTVLFDVLRDVLHNQPRRCHVPTSRACDAQLQRGWPLNGATRAADRHRSLRLRPRSSALTHEQSAKNTSSSRVPAGSVHMAQLPARTTRNVAMCAGPTACAAPSPQTTCKARLHARCFTRRQRRQPSSKTFIIQIRSTKTSSHVAVYLSDVCDRLSITGRANEAGRIVWNGALIH